MASSKNKRSAAPESRSEKAQVEPEANVFLPTASPPPARPLWVWIFGVLLVGWLLVLAYLAMTAGHFR